MTSNVTYGLDVSNHQPGLNLAAAKKQGFEFVVAKCTEGDFFYDPLYNDFRAQASAAGMLFAAYALIHHGNGAGQADFIAQHIGDKTVPVMVDFEPMSGSYPTVADMRAFLRRAHRIGLNVTLNYLPHWYWQEIGSPSLVGTPELIQSAYRNQSHAYASTVYASVGGNGSQDWAACGGKTPVILQFTDNGKLDGYSAGIDMDAYRGTRAELAALGLFKDYADQTPKRPHPHPTPGPTPHPTPPPVHRAGKFHVVKQGDTLGAIAAAAHIGLPKLYRLNRFRHPFLRRNARNLQVGWKIRTR